MIRVSQFCLTCGEISDFEMSEGDIRRYFKEANVPLPVDFPNVDEVSLPPEDCSWCEMDLLAEDDFDTF